MKKILNKIIIPISFFLIVVFISLVLTVSNFSSKLITKIFMDNFGVILSHIEGSVEQLDIKFKSLEEILTDNANAKLSSLVDIAYSSIEDEYNRYKSGLISEERAKDNAIKAIRGFRYDTNGYFWIDNTNYINLLLPPNPSAEGSDRSVLKDSKGKTMVKEMVDNSIKNGDAYVHYWFPKPGESFDSEKIGYTRLFMPWSWIVGTGFYIDEISKMIEKQRRVDTIYFNTLIQSKNIDGCYPLIFDRENTMIATPYSDKLFKKEQLTDSITGEDIVKKAFSIGDGILEYNYINEGDTTPTKKIALIKYYKHLDWIILYTMDKDIISTRVESIERFIIIIAVLAIIVSIILLIIVATRVVKNVKSVTDRIYEVSEGEGDLTHHIAVNSKDETGQLATYFNNFIHKLREMIIRIQEIGDASSQIGITLANNSEEISATVEEISSTMRSIKDKTSTLTDEVNNSNRNVSSIRSKIKLLKDSTSKESTYVAESSAAVEEMVASINAISNISQEKSRAISALTDVAREGEKDMDLTVKSIKNIEESAQSMLNMINVVTDVSDRINLLAMNAAIEAAHAGEAGKGFAVVANEIRKLAVVTAQSTNDMTNTLSSISQSIIDAANLSSTTGVTIKSITTEVIGVANSLTEMIHSFTEISQGTSQITDSLSRLVATSGNVSDAAVEMETATGDILGSLETITKLSHQNGNGITEINDGVQEISVALSDLASLSGENSHNIKSLKEIVDKFKT